MKEEDLLAISEVARCIPPLIHTSLRPSTIPVLDALWKFCLRVYVHGALHVEGSFGTYGPSPVLRDFTHLIFEVYAALDANSDANAATQTTRTEELLQFTIEFIVHEKMMCGGACVGPGTGAGGGAGTFKKGENFNFARAVGFICAGMQYTRSNFISKI